MTCSIERAVLRTCPFWTPFFPKPETLQLKCGPVLAFLGRNGNCLKWFDVWSTLDSWKKTQNPHKCEAQGDDCWNIIFPHPLPAFAAPVWQFKILIFCCELHFESFQSFPHKCVSKRLIRNTENALLLGMGGSQKSVAELSILGLLWVCQLFSSSNHKWTDKATRGSEQRSKLFAACWSSLIWWRGGGGKLHQRFWNHMWYKQTRVVSFSFSCVLGLSVSLVSSFRCAVSLLPQDNLHVCQNHKTLTFSGFPLWAGSCCLWARCQVRSIFRNETSVYSSLERSQKYIQECHL